ncbi:hypothetical protein T05_11185 [Trichinella murrelli]|uniref:Uncharacterized protein n=1 Tax=Trichinella murrelli TaxID=144512 RepID=A0A0V0TYF8_9BILA|nr:hypothetical protein T05_11185 [Trichinella murrelli]
MHCIKFDLYPLIEPKRKIFSSSCEKEETQSIPVSVDDIHLSMHLLCMDHLDMCPVDFDDHVDISVEIASIFDQTADKHRITSNPSAQGECGEHFDLVLCCHASGSLLNCLNDIY